MDFRSRDEIGRACDYLLDLVGREGAVAHSRVYDGKASTAERFAAELGVSRDRPGPFELFQLAVLTLEGGGYLQCRRLPQLLVDGMPDFEMRLTRLGHQLVGEGIRMHCLGFGRARSISLN